MASDPELAGAYHAKNGWYFDHIDDGSVGITKVESPAEYPAIEQQVVLDADTWASIVSFVSAHGENAETFSQALRFHKGLP